MRFHQGAGHLGGVVATTAVDGDSSTEEREEARLTANLILTNPDMLHATLLPDHARWSRCGLHWGWVNKRDALTNLILSGTESFESCELSWLTRRTFIAAPLAATLHW